MVEEGSILRRRCKVTYSRLQDIRKSRWSILVLVISKGILFEYFKSVFQFFDCSKRMASVLRWKLWLVNRALSRLLKSLKVYQHSSS